MARRTKQEAEQTRQAVQEAALELFLEKGYSRTTLAGISLRAGVTKGAFYWHFASKVDVFLSLVDRIMEPMEAVIEQAEAGDDPPLAKLRRKHLAMLRAFHSDERLRRVFEIVFLKVEHSPDAAPIARRERELVEKYVNAAIPLIRRAIECGDLRPGLDPELVARSMMAHCTGLIRHAIAAPDHFSLERNADELTDMFFRGLVP
ncbi:TetR family transcriptional regulator [Desulfocurvus sp. DL9XJH121]